MAPVRGEVVAPKRLRQLSEVLPQERLVLVADGATVLRGGAGEHLVTVDRAFQLGEESDGLVLVAVDLEQDPDVLVCGHNVASLCCALSCRSIAAFKRKIVFC